MGFPNRMCSVVRAPRLCVFLAEGALPGAHFVCALLNSQPMGFYSPSSLVRDAQKHGVEVREVSINVEHVGFDARIAE